MMLSINNFVCEKQTNAFDPMFVVCLQFGFVESPELIDIPIDVSGKLYASESACETSRDRRLNEIIHLKSEELSRLMDRRATMEKCMCVCFFFLSSPNHEEANAM